MDNFTLKDTDQLTRKDDIFTSEIDDEVVMLDETGDSYYGLNTIGAAIWNALETPLRYLDLVASLTKTYSISEQQCREDTLPFIESLVEKKLLSVDTAQ